MEIVSERSYHFGHERDVVWDGIDSLDHYQRRWPWLRDFEADELEVGAVWRCLIQPPLPYSLRIELHIDDVVPSWMVRATVRGDLTGRARIVLVDAPPVTEVVVSSTLSPSNRLVGHAARLIAPVARWGHDWILDTGAKQFAASLTSAAT